MEPESPTPAPQKPENKDTKKTPAYTKPVKVLFSELFKIISSIFQSFTGIIRLIVGIENTTDIEGTIASIRKGIEIKGYNIWILFCSAIIACIGLDTNSGAVIIGAMLISPLMSPILGIGLSIGIFDTETLKKSLYNFGIAVAISLIASFLYFLISPLGEETQEIAKRTRPTLLDVAVGFFGGIAGIVAGSRKEKTNAIPGVAIATALMPPLCVAGFGLASFKFNYFLDAFYLFFLNAVFIALSTYLIVRFLRFPFVYNISEKSKRKMVRGILAFVILLIIPSGIIFYKTIRQNRFEETINTYLEACFTPKTNVEIEKWKVIETDSTSQLRVTVQGDYVPKDTIAKFQALLEKEYKVKGLQLHLIQGPDVKNQYQVLRNEMLQLIDEKTSSEKLKQQKIEELQEIIKITSQQLELVQEDNAKFGDLGQEILLLNSALEQAAVFRMYLTKAIRKAEKTSFQKDTLLAVRLDWNAETDSLERAKREKELYQWATKRYEQDTIVILQANN